MTFVSMCPFSHIVLNSYAYLCEKEIMDSFITLLESECAERPIDRLKKLCLYFQLYFDTKKLKAKKKILSTGLSVSAT